MNRIHILAASSTIALLAAVPAFAQTASEGADIIVTGTRVGSTITDAPAPIQIITGEQIRASGEINMQDVLQRNPTLGASGFTRTNSNFDLQNAGVASINLRNLGADRTLVLIDGKRVVPGIAGRSAVNINMIPTQFLDRVDVMTGGTSSVYGADAVAGVVNFVLKDRFEGIQIGAQTGISSRGDGAEHAFDITGGTTFSGGRGSLMGHFSYTRQDEVMLGARSTEAGSMAIDQTSLGYLNGNDADLFKPTISQSGYNNDGTYYADNLIFTYNGDQLVQGGKKFNRSDYRYLAIPTDRYLGALRGSYEFSSAATAYFDAAYAETRVRTQTEAFPLSTAYLTDSGQIPVESMINGVLTRHAFVPDAIYDDAGDNDGDGLRDIYVIKRLGDYGPRRIQDRRRNYRAVVGLKGEIASNWRYDAYYVFGQTRQVQTGTGMINTANLTNALAAVVDTQELNGNGNRTEIVCVDPAARAAGCIPANIFGAGSLASSAAYTAAPQSLVSRITQHVAHADVRGTLGSITQGAAPVTIDIGVEYQANRSSADFDAVTEAGLNAGGRLPDVKGRYDVKEIFTEAAVPLLANAPFAHDLIVRGAVRASDYSTAGHAFSYNYGAEWSPVQGVRLRVSRAQSVRAPNIGELFTPGRQSFPTGLKDPCIGITAVTAGRLADNCRADAGVAANIAANGSFTTTAADTQAVISQSGGNERLKVEKGQSFSAGIVIEPGLVPGLTLSADYYSIKVQNAIVPANLQYQLNSCYGEGDGGSCSRIERRQSAQGPNSAGSLARVDGGFTNSGGLRTSGIDVGFGYHNDLTAIGLPGAIAISGSYTHLISGYSIPVPGGARNEFAGEIGASKDRFTATAAYRVGGATLTFTSTYVGEAFLDDQFTGYKAGTAPAGQSRNLYRIAPEFYGDIQLSFAVSGGSEFYLGAKNLFDNKPPFLADISAAASDAGVSTDPAVYDTLGRRLYAGFRARF